jgi:hypothetical protein
VSRTGSPSADLVHSKGPVSLSDAPRRPIGTKDIHPNAEATTPIDSEDKDTVPVAGRTWATNRIEEIDPVATKTGKINMSPESEKDSGKHNTQIAVRNKPTSITERKRLADENADPADSSSETDQPPAKRLRRGTIYENDTRKPELALRPPAPKTYGKKGRTSSPVPPTVHEIDFDELPAPSTDQTSQNKSNANKTSGRILTTKGKSEKPPAKVKAVSTKEKAKKSVVASAKTIAAKKEEKPVTRPKLANKGQEENSIPRVNHFLKSTRNPIEASKPDQRWRREAVSSLGPCCQY